MIRMQRKSSVCETKRNMNVNFENQSFKEKDNCNVDLSAILQRFRSDIEQFN